MTLFMDGIEYLTLTEASRQLNTTETRVLMLLKQKALQGELVDGTWFVSVSSLSAFDPSQATTQAPSCRTSCTASSCGCH